MIDAIETTRCPLPDPARLGLTRLAGAGGAFVDADGWQVGGFDIDESEADGGLARAAERAYERVFAALRAAGSPPLLRLWNYLPRINEESGGALERYRQFNVGRQAAFVAAGEAAFEGAPAACALGKRSGPLSVRYLAGPARVLALENPRQVPAWAYSRRWGPKSPTFSRAVLADAGAGRVALLISGTASIVGERSLHEGDVGAQVGETLANLRALLGVAEARSSARFALDALALTVYVRRAEDWGDVRTLLQAAAPHAAARADCFEADICRRELLVEIEAHAVVPGALT
jgi:chorismate lyase / 3-hydroxybenzoate synthase